MLNVDAYDAYIPANTEIMLGRLKRIIEWDMLNPVRYYQINYSKFRISDWLVGAEPQPFDNEDQQRSIVDELQFYLGLALLLIGLALLFAFCRRFRCIPRKPRHGFRAASRWLHKKFTYNWSIRYVTAAFLPLSVTCGYQLSMWMRESIYQDEFERRFTVVLCAFQGLVILISLIFLVRGRHVLDHPNIFRQVSYLYEGIHLYKDFANLRYYPVFIFRRLAFVLVPTFMYQWPCQ